MAKKKKVYDPLAPARTKPKSVKVLELNPAAARNMGLGEFEAFPAFPMEVFECTNLERLEVFRGIAWEGDPRIPKELGTLKKLRSLSLGGLSFTSLPPEVGQLTKLEQLELDYAESLKELPRAIGKLSALRALHCSYCTSLGKLPAEIGQLRELRELALGETALKAVPAELWKLPHLETLILPVEIAKLPPGISALRKLEHLSLSSAALASIAKELPALRNLKTLSVGSSAKAKAKAKTLPAEVGELTGLVELNAAFLDLAALPPLGKLANLARLDVSGNALRTLLPIVASLPKLKDLDYTGNRVPATERRALDALMKLSPGKRAKPGGPKPKMLGKVASINASLSMLVADAKLAAQWRGVGDAAGDDLDDTDWDRARVALADGDSAPIRVAGERALALSLDMGQGIVEVFRVGERLVLTECIVEDLEDELFLEYVASAPHKPRKVGDVALSSRSIAFLPTTDAGTTTKLGKRTVAKFGSEGCGLLVDLGHARATITLEAEAKGSWGQARRAFVEASSPRGARKS